MLRALFHYFGDARRLGLADFARKHGEGPWLLVEAFDQAEEVRVATVAGGGGAGGERVLGPIRKREGANAFETMITVGRAANNDLPIPSSDVSSFHAYFTLGEGGAIHLTDAASSYGTRLDGVLLESNRAAPVRAGQTLYFASVQARVLEVEQAYLMLKV
ncbi:MAG: FHA domain-containing protein [Planctomycetota bacterium]